VEGLLLPLLGIAVLVIVVLAALYFSLKSQIPREVERAHAIWREKEMEAIRKEQVELAQKEAMTQLQQWRGQELDLARRQQLETARSEAAVSLEQWKVEHSQSIRQDAIQKSQAVTLGKVTEHFVPYLPDFTYNPKDARFLGSPVDFVVFDGLNDGEVKGVVFIEVKTGKSALSSRERRIREAVQSGKVQWIELRPQLELKQPTEVESSPTIVDVIEKNTEFDVILKDSGAKKVEVFKIVRQLMPNLDMKQAADIVDGTPQIVLSAVSKEVATDPGPSSKQRARASKSRIICSQLKFCSSSAWSELAGC
jgi:predicted Holliday junction resolvase-like endonuclease